MPEAHSNRFLMFLLLVFLALMGLIVSGFAAPIILGTLLGTLSYPLYERLLRRLGGRSRNTAALIMLLLVIFAIVLPFFGITTLLAKEGQAIFLETRGQLSLTSPWVLKLDLFLERFGVDLEAILAENVTPELQRFGLLIYQRVTNFLLDAVNLIIGFLLMLITFFYVLKDGRELGAFLMRAVPMKDQDKLRIFHTFRRTGRAVFVGFFLSALAQGALGGAGFLLFGLHHPVFWGAVMTFFALIPLLGPYLVFIPAGIYLLLNSATLLVPIAFLIYNVLLVSMIDNVIKPSLISGKINIHPLVIILAILGGLKLFGALGMIYGPLIASIFLVILDVYLIHRERREAASVPL